MLRLLGMLKRRLHGCRKGGARIFDESALGGQNEGIGGATGGHVDLAWRGGISALLVVALAPLSLLSCRSQLPGDVAAEGAWASREFSRIEMGYLNSVIVLPPLHKEGSLLSSFRRCCYSSVMAAETTASTSSTT